VACASYHRQGFLDGETLERVIDELPEPLRGVVQFSAFTGCRKGEILSLTWLRWTSGQE
jgi:integrase